MDQHFLSKLPKIFRDTATLKSLNINFLFVSCNHKNIGISLDVYHADVKNIPPDPQYWGVLLCFRSLVGGYRYPIASNKQ